MNKKACLSKYSDEYYGNMFGIYPEMDGEESARKAKTFLDKYAMNDDSYHSLCIPAQQRIFRHPAPKGFNILEQEVYEIFHDGVKFFSYVSTPLFWKENFELFQAIGRAFGERNLFIIEDEECEEDPQQTFKLQIPIETTWSELSDGGFISDVVLNMHHNNYFVFGDSGNWGRWCDYENGWMDYEVFAYKRLCPEILRYKDWCSISEEEYQEVEKAGIPHALKNNICIMK